MIHIHSIPLPDAAQNELERCQAEIDEESTYKTQVEKAKALFSNRYIVI